MAKANVSRLHRLAATVRHAVTPGHVVNRPRFATNHPGSKRHPITTTEKRRRRKQARISRARTFNWPRVGA